MTLNQVSRKLLSELTPEDRKRLNPQDLSDLKEIRSLEELAEIKAKPAKRNKPATESSDFDIKSSSDYDLHDDLRQIEDDKGYLLMNRQSRMGELAMQLLLPPYDIE